MAQTDPNVKPCPDDDNRRSLLLWIDHHPRTGWYVSTILTMNLILNLLDALNMDLFWFTR